ncbi:hypothetical protein [Saezia sanguinis]|uniref:hypothetical protein n=1 Tax=Saezia sanguinis TaxID=1965230 RepID=UPI000F8CCC7E|nr:hypothetical protein [Saezia sanguinis]
MKRIQAFFLALLTGTLMWLPGMGISAALADDSQPLSDWRHPFATVSAPASQPPDQPACTLQPGETTAQLAQRGCCSHHRGVCGCTPNGRVKCCDDSLSPTCRCDPRNPDDT